MFERFSERMREVVVLASEEARALDHDHIGTEHLLIGLLRADGLATAVLAPVGLTADSARADVVRIAGRGKQASPPQLELSPRAVRVLELSLREAHGAAAPEVEAGHLLLALLVERQGVAARILLDAGADEAAIRAMLRPAPRWEVGEPAPSPESGELEVDLGWRGRSITLAALGAAVLSRSAFDRRRTGGLAPVEMQLLVHLTLAAKPEEEFWDGEEVESLAGALACDHDDVALAIGRLIRQGLISRPAETDADRVIVTPAGAARVREWLGLIVSLFARWPPAISGVDDV